MQFAGICHLDYSGIHIHTHNLYTMLGSDNCGGKSDVAQSHKTSFHLSYDVVIIIIIYVYYE